jgi:myo-inositol-1(or 4)-monophosphatase
MEAFVTLCEEAARAGGAVLRGWEGRLAVREKGPRDLVTEADLASQEAIQAVISRAFPGHAFLGEEGPPSGASSKADVCWIVDPLDGTTNYVHGVPHYCVSVAVAVQGRIEAGVVFEPCSGECYKASRGGGASKNGRPLRTSEVSQLEGALVAVSLPPRVRPHAPQIADLVAIMGACQAVRRTGSAALNLCYVAEGRFDGYWSTSDHPWDVAAGVLIVCEAGGVVTAPDGGPFDLWKANFVAAATAQLNEKLRWVLAGRDSESIPKGR